MNGHGLLIACGAFLCGFGVAIAIQVSCMDDNRAHSAYACRAAGPEQHWLCIDQWWQSRGMEPPWPTIRAAEKARVQMVGREKIRPKLGGM